MVAVLGPARSRGRSAPGFTVVELVVVLVLLGVLAVSALARLPGRDAVDALRLSGELLETARLARAAALADAGAALVLRIEAQGEGFRMAVLRDGTPFHENILAPARATLRVQAGPAAGPVDTGSALEVAYDGLGDVSAVTLGTTPGAPGAGVRLVVTGAVDRYMCIHPTGFPDAAPCA